ncbi:D-isomer specific 2-hydroxyacid dehydrogenase [Aspergillus keveii]|uniref:D-isomer specific 2-hydroxyacid dehydrogenase n=1 Tax=Aspergillus keveii TaxID=714993 RepID=A0ABR4FPY4_9EURO
MARLQEGQTVLCTVDWAPHEISQLREAFKPAELIHCNKHDTATIQRTLADAHVAILASDITPDMLSVESQNLTWIHCDHAGLEKSACPEIFDRGLIVTSSAGRSAPALAQHAFYFALSLAYDSRALLGRQEMREWRQESREELRLRGCLYGRRLGILGFGNTGKEIAALGRAFGMHVTVLRRRKMRDLDEEVPPTVDIMLSTEGGDTVDGLLGCDVVMLAASLTDSTHHLFGAREFNLMKSSAIIVNIGRGSLIDESALAAALNAGEIAGAGLDVFEVEPLPVESPLWGLPNVLITPHSTPGMPDRTARSIEIICGNIQRFRKGEPMLNQLRRDDIYTKRKMI